MYAYTFRILRFKPDAHRICIYYKTREALERGALRWAERDKFEVGTEEFCNPSDDPKVSQWDWWLDGVVTPA